MRKHKKILGIFLAGALLVTGVTAPRGNAVTAAEEKDYGISNPRAEDGVTTWDKVRFGSYYQDADMKPEPIKWRVLSVDGNDAFLLADRTLDAKPYNELRDNVTWETCTLRTWLNSDFYNEAFNAEEKKAVMETEVVNEDNPKYGTDGGSDTRDKIYLLSVAEAADAAYGFDTTFEENTKLRESENTDYAKIKNVMSSDETDILGNGYWWLRSPGHAGTVASYVYFRGNGHSDNSVNRSDGGVRPVLHVDLSSAGVKDAGEVDSEGNITASADGISAPRIRNGVTTWDCVYFGRYRQNATFEKKALEWRVLSVDGDDAFLLADKNLDAKPYNDEWTEVTWETCTLWTWLNGYFYNEAFNAEEKKAVMETEVVNEDNPEYGTDGGNDTKDNVFLLSIAEAANAQYGFESTFDTKSETRKSKNTDYAKVHNASSGFGIESGVGNGSWWLRSLGGNNKVASIVMDDTMGSYNGLNVGLLSYSVRPAVHINLSSSAWSKAGEVSSNEPDETPEPTQKPDETPEPTQEPQATPEPSQRPDETQKPEDSTQIPPVTGQPASPSNVTQVPPSTQNSAIKNLSLSGVKCVKNAKKITGKVSVSKATVQIKVGKKAYKKASVKGKKFTLKLNYRLKKKTKVTVKVTKKGYKSIVKSYKVK